MSLNDVEMPQEQAKMLFDNCAMLILLDVPIGTEFGIDYNSWQVGEKFKGVKMIPPGFHFIYYSAKSREGNAAPRSGFIHFFKQKEIVYKRWDLINEMIMEEKSDSEDIERFVINKQELDQYLGVYPYNSYKKWLSLTSFITENTVTNINPLCKIVTSATPYISPSSNTESRKNATTSSGTTTTSKSSFRYYANQLYSDIDDDTRLPAMDVLPGSELRFTPIPRIHHPAYSEAHDVTHHCMDRSYTLRAILETYDSLNAVNELLGEIQLAFVCFLIGQVFDAFEQWKRLVDLLSSSPGAMAQYPQLYSDFIFVLHFQIGEIPEDFFTDIVSRENFLVTTLTKFFENIDVSETTEAVKSKGNRFRSNLEKKFDWIFDNNDEEYLPAVVYL